MLAAWILVYGRKVGGMDPVHWPQDAADDGRARSQGGDANVHGFFCSFSMALSW
jgi:hypothetical protein